MGYIEYLAVKQDVDALLRKGYRFALIHRMLLEKGKISMSYESFARYASGRSGRGKPYPVPEEHTQTIPEQKKEQVACITPKNISGLDAAHKKTETSVPQKAESFTSGKQYSLNELFFDED